MAFPALTCTPAAHRPCPAHSNTPSRWQNGVGMHQVLPRCRVRSAAIQLPNLSIRAFWAPTPKTSTAAEPQLDGGEGQGTEQTLAEEVMLKRAASRLSRGTATCLTCKGQGTCPCPVCKGARLLARDQATMHPMKQAVREVKSLMHVTTERDWLISNRCRRCSARGVLICEVCRGSGLRYPNLIPQDMLNTNKHKSEGHAALPR